MEMKSIKLDVSSDIFEQVMAFLEILPQNKVRITENNLKNKPSKNKDSFLVFSFNSWS